MYAGAVRAAEAGSHYQLVAHIFCRRYAWRGDMIVIDSDVRGPEVTDICTRCGGVSQPDGAAFQYIDVRPGDGLRLGVNDNDLIRSGRAAVGRHESIMQRIVAWSPDAGIERSAGRYPIAAVMVRAGKGGRLAPLRHREWTDLFADRLQRI